MQDLRRPISGALLAVLGLGLVAFVANLAGLFGGEAVDSFFTEYVYTSLIGGAAVVCLLRPAESRRDRLPWILLGLGLASWTAGEAYYAAVLANLDEPPFPSLADALYLGFYPAAFTALALMLRRRRASAGGPSVWLDAGVAALAAAALVVTLGAGAAVDSATGSVAAVVTTAAYPIGDLLMLGIVIAAFGLSGWRPGRRLVILGAGLSLLALADVIYLAQIAHETYEEGTLLDALWPAAALTVAFASLQPAGIEAAEPHGWRPALIPLAGALLALFLVSYDHFDPIYDGALALTTTSLLLVIVRMCTTFLANMRMLERSRSEALTDSLTGLANRRRLMQDLDAAMADAETDEPYALALFDLDGFKVYNDSFGHAAGDALLARLGRRLQEASGQRGRAYRLGGDEFCVLLASSGVDFASRLEGCDRALCERGEGFGITASRGVVVIPDDTGLVGEALTLADHRMYAQKASGRASAQRQSRDVLLRTLEERHPELHEHLTDVARLAIRVARGLGMEQKTIDEVGRAAELHDVGKVAIPDDILAKPAPLDEEEWRLMRNHTVIGERILDAAPALRKVAKLVRSSHERWDGKGYPDGLAGEAIPLGARVIAVCDAYDAMVAERPYRSPRTPAEAEAEIRRCAGTQFDPRVVDAFVRARREQPRALARVPA